MEHEVSIRINFPEHISEILHREKKRFVAEYGSAYASEPHLTLYLDRYTKEGFVRLMHGIRELKFEPFVLTLLDVRVSAELNHRNLYVIEISNTEQLKKLQRHVQKIACATKALFYEKRHVSSSNKKGSLRTASERNYQAVGKVNLIHTLPSEKLSSEDDSPLWHTLEKTLKIWAAQRSSFQGLV
jgi:hypothetical protein